MAGNALGFPSHYHQLDRRDIFARQQATEKLKGLTMFSPEEKFARQKLNAQTALDQGGRNSVLFAREKERLLAYGEEGAKAVQAMLYPKKEAA